MNALKTPCEFGKFPRIRPLTMAVVVSFSLGALPGVALSSTQGKRPAAPTGLVATISTSGGDSTATSLSSEVNATTWQQLKDLTYERRAEFNAGVDRLELQVDSQIKELQTKRATISGSSAQAWDFAMKEMEESRAFLRSAAAEASKANEETWTDRRDKVGLAWERTQDAYDKVKASTTN